MQPAPPELDARELHRDEDRRRQHDREGADAEGSYLEEDRVHQPRTFCRRRRNPS